MSGHKYITNSDNLFEDEDEIDDETFLRGGRSNQAAGRSTNPFENQQQTYEERRKEIEARTLDSTQRSLGLLHETEEVGKATAVELSKQREQLENTNRQLDEINSTLRFSQKHLNGLKSVFGSLKNYLSGNRDSMMPPPKMSSSTSGSKISDQQQYLSSETESINPEERYNSHPVARIRSDPPSPEQQIYQQSSNELNSFDKRLEQNLDDMCGNLSRLKSLAGDLRTEIDTQNELIDSMSYKMEDVDTKMGKQNKDMNKLLGRK